jgi:hypothetical protein
MNEVRGKDEEELMVYWQQTMGEATAGGAAHELAARVTRFDRTIFRRNSREYIAGLILLAWSGYNAFHGSRQALSLMAGVLFMMGYLWWSHRGMVALDPSADGRTYRNALLTRLDAQIRLLSRVRYWYLLPLYLPMVWQAVEHWPHSPWAAGLGLLVVTAFFVMVGWLNEVLAVKKLTQDRANVEQMFKETDS